MRGWRRSQRSAAFFIGGINKGGDVQVDTASISAKELAAVAAAACGAGDHGIDVVDVALIILCDRPAQLCFEICIRLMQRNRNSDGVFFFHAGNRAIVVLDIDCAGTGFPIVEAFYEAVCRPCGRRILSKAEGIKKQP